MTRDGVTPIDLIDGNSLAEKLKELKLGVKIEVEPTPLQETHVKDGHGPNLTDLLNSEAERTGS